MITWLIYKRRTTIDKMGIYYNSAFGYGFIMQLENTWEDGDTTYEKLSNFIDELNYNNDTNIKVYYEGTFIAHEVFICTGGFENYYNSFVGVNAKRIIFEVSDKDIAVMQVISETFTGKTLDMRWLSYNWSS